MVKRIFTLVPDWVNFESFWVEIRKRNRWLIQLRYLAVALLLSFLLGAKVVQFYFPEMSLPFDKIIFFPPLILFYNILFHLLWKKYPEISKKLKVHSLHFSLLQISVDFVFLLLIIYFTGGVESPFNTFFVFHLIIGSLILPGAVINLLMTLVLLISITGSILEYNGLVPHYQITGIIEHPLYNDTNYLIVFYSTFAIVVYISIYLANSIAKVLYQREKALATAYKELEEAERSKSRYVMTVVHDLKTPISAALTWVEVITSKSLGELPNYLEKPIDRIQQRLEGALTLIDDILKVSQIKLTTTIEKVPTNLKELFDDIYNQHRILIVSKNLNYSFKSSILEPTLTTDRNLLKLALSNLVSNSIKYTEPNGLIEVTINDKSNSIEIIVADDGIGIPKEELDKIFNEFYRTKISREKNIEGSGLGMTLVREIITKLGGKIEIKSPSYLQKEGRPGTEVILTLLK